MGVLDHIVSLLDEKGIKYKFEANVISMLWKTDHFGVDFDGDGVDDTESLKIKIVTNRDETWVYIVAPFTNFFKVPEDKRAKFSYDMLKESYNANGVKFAIDNDDDVIVIAETNDTDITVEEIHQLVSHTVHACDRLWEIYPE